MPCRCNYWYAIAMLFKYCCRVRPTHGWHESVGIVLRTVFDTLSRWKLNDYTEMIYDLAAKMRIVTF